MSANGNGALVPTKPEQRSIIAKMAEHYSMEAKNFEATLRATVVPKECTKEDFAAFLIVAEKYQLNPILKEIYAFPKKGGGIQPIVGVDGWSNIINSHPQCDGFEFEDSLDENGDLISITCRIYRKDRSKPSEAREYMIECRMGGDVWKKWPRRMLRHKAFIQAGRYAFGFTGIVDPDEYERGLKPANDSPEPTSATIIEVPSAPAEETPKQIEAQKEEPIAVEQLYGVAEAVAELDMLMQAAKTEDEFLEIWLEVPEKVGIAGISFVQHRGLFDDVYLKHEKRIEALASPAEASEQFDMLAVPAAA